MIYLYYPLFTWIAFCTLLSPTGVRGDGSEINVLHGTRKGVNLVYSGDNVKHVITNSNPLERNKRALQNIYLIREKKEDQDPMGYLSRLYSDMEFASKNNYLDWSQEMLQAIVDPPLVELYIHKKVPNCASEFNITKIIELVDDDKRQRICPCTCQIASNVKPEEKPAVVEGPQENVQAETAVDAAPEMQAPAIAPVSQSPGPSLVGATGQPQVVDESSTPCEFSAEASSAAPSQAGQVAVVSKAEVPPAKSEKTADANAKTPKPDQSKAAISQKKQEDKKTKVATPAQRPNPIVAPRIGPPLSRVTGTDPKKTGAMVQPRPGNPPGIRPPNSNLQMKNLIKTPQQIANKPLHSKNPDFKPPAPKAPMAHIPPQDRGKTLNAKQPIANPGWDLAEPGAAFPGVYPY